MKSPPALPCEQLARMLVPPGSCLDGTLELLPLTTGRSGAETYEVRAGSERFVLKIHPPGPSPRAFSERLAIQQVAAKLGITPPVVSWDEAQRCVLTAYIADTSFFGAVFNPARRQSTLQQLAEILAKLHTAPWENLGAALCPVRQAQQMLDSAASRFALPSFASEAWQHYCAQEPQQPVNALCHLDLNPTNLVYDGARVWLVDFDTAGPGDRWLDVATIASLLRFDRAATEHWVALYTRAGDVPAPEPHAFAQARRLVFLAYGCAFLDLVTALPEPKAPQGHNLADCYADLQAGRLDMASDWGRFRLASAYFAEYWEVV